MSSFDPSLQRLLLNPTETIREIDKVRCERSLKFFVQRYWHILEPSTPLVDGWPLDAVCEHLEAVSWGEIVRLLMNVCPGFMKSLLTDVFWPAWEWTAFQQPNYRYVTFSYAAQLTERDNRRFLDLLRHPQFVADWGDRFTLRKQGEVLVSNDKMGWKLATSIGGVGTGERGDRVILDDPHSVKESESEAVRGETVRWFKEAMSNRLNDMEKSAVVVIMQRVHEADVSGEIVANARDYEHLMIPMEWDGRRYTTSIGWTDPRQEQGELAWPSRFSPVVVNRLKSQMGPYAYAAQYQQMPAPRGGGILKRSWWRLWDEAEATKYGCVQLAFARKGQRDPATGRTMREGEPIFDADRGEQLKQVSFPKFSHIVASVDTAYTEKEENDPTAMTVWGVWEDQYGMPKVMLITAWQDRLMFHDALEKIAYTCRRYKADHLVVEAKASGISVFQELERLHAGSGWTMELFNPGRSDKIARVHSIAPIFANEMVFAPDKEWADMVITQCESFPKAAHDDLVDTCSAALRHLRDNGLLLQGSEIAEGMAGDLAYHSAKSRPLYPA